MLSTMRKIVKIALISFFVLVVGILLLSWLTTSVEPFKSFTKLSPEEAGNLGAEHGEALGEGVKGVMGK